MRECSKRCLLRDKCCEEEECRMWIDYEEDKNCTLIAVHRHGSMTLREIAVRHGISTVRVKQILDQTVKKLKKIKNVISMPTY